MVPKRSADPVLLADPEPSGEDPSGDCSSLQGAGGPSGPAQGMQINMRVQQLFLF